MAVLSFLFGIQPVLTAKFVPHEVIPSTVIFAQEIIKFVVACIAFFGFEGKKGDDFRKEWNFLPWVHEAFLPATLYCISNMLCLVGEGSRWHGIKKADTEKAGN